MTELRLTKSLKPLRRVGALMVVVPMIAALARDPGPLPVAPVATHSLADIQASGTLKVVTRRGYTTYFQGSGDFSGFEHDLLKRFADRLGVELEVAVADTPTELLSLVRDGKFHMGAGAIDEQTANRADLSTSASFTQRKFQVVTSSLDKPVEKAADLVGRHIVVPSGSAAVALLQNVTMQHPLVRWEISSTTDEEQLVRAVNEGKIDVTVVDSKTLSVMRQQSSFIKSGMTFTQPADIAWAFNPEADVALIAEADMFFEEVGRHGVIGKLTERYFDSTNHQTYLNLKVFRKRIEDTLPRFRHMFIEAGHRYDVDWRLVAALSYQESMWNPTAESHTGVRGMMQLTKATARQLKADREDVYESIMAGARYLQMLTDRVSTDVEGADRLWMALASYNVGPGHVDDARQLTRTYNGDADSWRDVKRYLPLLKEREYYKQTRFGRARGDEAVQLVSRVRSYYNVLLQTENTRSDYRAEPVKRRDGNNGNVTWL